MLGGGFCVIFGVTVDSQTEKALPLYLLYCTFGHDPILKCPNVANTATAANVGGPTLKHTSSKRECVSVRIVVCVVEREPGIDET